MDIDKLSNSGKQVVGSPELWLTPVIGLVLLAPLIYHWRVPLTGTVGPVLANDWPAKLRGNIGLDIAVGVVPLFAAAGLQRLFRTSNWLVWLRILAGSLFGSLVVGAFYYYALYPLSHWHKPYDEGEANVMAIFKGDIFCLAVAGGATLFVSTLLISVWTQHRRKA